MFTLTSLVAVLLILPYSSPANPVLGERQDLTPSIQLSTSKTFNRREDPSSYPYGNAITNEFQWRNWDPSDKDQRKDGERIHKAFVEWQDFAKAGLTAASIDTGDTFKRWFGKQDNNTENKKVFAAAYDGTSNTATVNVAKMICDRLDFKSRCKETTAAWTIADTGEFHICPYGLDRNLNSDIDCATLDGSCSAAMRSLPMTLMHEMTRGGFKTDDLAAGAYNCFKLSDEDKGENAQNYAWLAGEAYWSGQCSKTFGDPDPGVRSTQTDEAIDSASGLADPTCMGQTEFHQEEADANIVKFCGNSEWQNQVIVPLVSMGDEKTSDGRPKVYQIEQKFLVNGGTDNLWLSINFAEETCLGSFQFNQADCLANLRSVLNGCDTGGLFPKNGGLIKESACGVYHVAAAPTSDPDPVFLLSQSASLIGNFTCNDTDISALGPGSPLAGTCTCWYSGMQSVINTFDMPASGGCAAIKSSSNPKTN